MIGYVFGGALILYMILVFVGGIVWEVMRDDEGRVLPAPEDEERR